MRQALVTGATGGLGRALVEALLAEGYGVRATGRDPAAGAELQAAGAEFIPAELTDPAAPGPLTAGIDAVFHAAALSSPWGPPALFEAVNVEATRHLFSAAQAAGASAFIYISTPSVYSEPKDRLNLTEASPLAPRFANAYAATKYAAERLVLAVDAPGFATIAIRPRALIGPHDKVLLPRILRVASRGRFPLFRGGQALIDLTDVRDAALAALAADRNRKTAHGQVFNISGGAPATVGDTLREVFAALGLKPRLVPIAYPIAAAACRALEAVCARLPGRPEPPATVYSLSTLAFSQTFDLTGAAKGLGWRPTHTPSAAIARTADHWARHAPL
ncbi:NAD(P)-dependent oxidoreductase [soil metagenome]